MVIGAILGPMRQGSIPNAVVEALNEVFDKNPEAVAALVACRAGKQLPPTSTDPVSPPASGVDVLQYQELGRSSGPTVGALDLVNAILEKLSPGKRVGVITVPDGMEGFTLTRDRKPKEASPE